MLVLGNFFLGACFLCAMDTEDLLRISITANVCAAFFFVSRALLSRLAGRWRDCIEEKSIWRSIVDMHEDEPWMFPRFCLDVLQSTVMTITGLTILCMDDVIHNPFRGTFSSITKTGFSIAIGCYIYRIFQDSILHSKVKNFKVDLVHHLVTIAVYSVFLTYRENALFGAIGLICTASVPCVEITRLLKVVSETSGKPTTLMGSYRWNLLIGAVIAFTVRLVIPVILGTFAFVTSSPLRMSIPVVAFFFTALMFFGSINIWLCVMAVLAIYRRKRRYLKDIYVSALDGQSKNTFPTKDTQQATILAKKNPIKSRLTTPCANVNLTPSTQTQTKMSNNHSLPNNYAKVPVNDALVLPFSENLRNHSRRPSIESSQIESTRDAGELMVVQVGEEDDFDRQRAVRFLVPRSRSSQNSIIQMTSIPPTVSNNGESPQLVIPQTNMPVSSSGGARESSRADSTPFSSARTSSSTAGRSPHVRTLPEPSQLTRSNSVPTRASERHLKEATVTLSSRAHRVQGTTHANAGLDHMTTCLTTFSRQFLEDFEHRGRRNSLPSIQRSSHSTGSTVIP